MSGLSHQQTREQRERDARIARLENHAEAEKIREGKLEAFHLALRMAAARVKLLDNTELKHDKLAAHLLAIAPPVGMTTKTPYPVPVTGS